MKDDGVGTGGAGSGRRVPVSVAVSGSSSGTEASGVPMVWRGPLSAASMTMPMIRCGGNPGGGERTWRLMLEERALKSQAGASVVGLTVFSYFRIFSILRRMGVQREERRRHLREMKRGPGREGSTSQNWKTQSSSFQVCQRFLDTCAGFQIIRFPTSTQCTNERMCTRKTRPPSVDVVRPKLPCFSLDVNVYLKRLPTLAGTFVIADCATTISTILANI